MHLLVKVDGDWLSQADSVAEARMPLWLQWSMAKVLAMAVAAGGFAAARLINAPADRLDAFAAQQIRMSGPFASARVRRRTGQAPGAVRRGTNEVRTTLYAASTSFVRSLARRDGGYRLLLGAIADFDNEITTYERLSGRSLDNSRREWMAFIGVEIAPSSVSPSR